MYKKSIKKGTHKKTTKKGSQKSSKGTRKKRQNLYCAHRKYGILNELLINNQKINWCANVKAMQKQESPKHIHEQQQNDNVAPQLKTQMDQVQQLKPQMDPAHDQVQQLKTQIEQLQTKLQTLEFKKEPDTCVACLERNRDVAFQPCGHKVICQSCGNNLLECPICRTQKQGLLRIFE
jgi:hypothetical protein